MLGGFIGWVDKGKGGGTPFLIGLIIYVYFMNKALQKEYIKAPIILGIILLLLGGLTLILNKKNEDKIISYFILIIGSVTSIAFIYKSYQRRCKNCGKWNALVEIDRKIINKEDTFIIKKLTERRRDSKGHVYQTIDKEVNVPAYRITYKVTDECKYCGKTYQYEDVEKVEK